MAAKQKAVFALAKPQFDFSQGLGWSYKGAGPAQGSLARAAFAYTWAERWGGPKCSFIMGEQPNVSSKDHRTHGKSSKIFGALRCNHSFYY